MAENYENPTTPTDADGMATVVYGDALAVGADTLTWVDAVLSMDDHGEVTIATGAVTATAAAEPSADETAFASAVTDVFVSGADIVIIKTHNKPDGGEGSSYDVSITKFKAIDIEHMDGATKVIYSDKTTHSAQATIDIDGNVAIASFDAQASGDNTFVGVDALVLAIEDELSQSTVMITSEVG